MQTSLSMRTPSISEESAYTMLHPPGQVPVSHHMPQTGEYALHFYSTDFSKYTSHMNDKVQNKWPFAFKCIIVTVEQKKKTSKTDNLGILVEFQSISRLWSNNMCPN